MTPRYSPPPKRTTFDKWAVLGQRRRAYTGQSDAEQSPDLYRGRRNVGLGFAGFGDGVWDKKTNTVIKDTASGKGCPWARDVKGRARDQQENRKNKDLGDLEWVGGWHDLHL